MGDLAGPTSSYGEYYPTLDPGKELPAGSSSIDGKKQDELNGPVTIN